MIGVTILDRDKDGMLVPSLQGILMLLEPEARGLTWVVSNAEAVGSEAEKLHEVADQNRSLPFSDLLQIANAVDQVVDGEFAGYDSTHRKRLVIRAVDSSAFDVESDDENVVCSVEAQFNRTARYEP